MTLEEFEKIREEKRKVLLAMKPEERKVDFDKDFESMKQLSIKKGDDIFIQLVSFVSYTHMECCQVSPKHVANLS